MKPDPFRTITAEDWKRELARARAETNAISAHVAALAARIAALPKGKP